MATKFLILLRHGKSDWQQAIETDFERVLTQRGKQDILCIAKWLAKNSYKPETVLCSSANRTRQTLQIILQQNAWSHAKIVNDKSVDETSVTMGDNKSQALSIDYRDSLYLASAGEIVAQSQQALAKVDCVLLVGHNPGIEDALEFFCGSVPRTANGEIMTPGSLALIRFAPNDAYYEQGELVDFIRPEAISE